MPNHRAAAVRVLVRIAILAVVGFLIAAAPAQAARSWRCGARLVGTGSSPDEVYALCGEPVDRTFTTELVTVRVAPDVAVTRAVPVERWLYNPGPKRFLRYLTFRDGALVDIDEGGYGY